MTSGSNIFNDFPEHQLTNFMLFKQYRSKSGQRVILFKARFFSFHYYEYEQFKHQYGN